VTVEGDRTGQVWKLVNAIALVVGPPRHAVQEDDAGRLFELLLHPCVLLESSSPRVTSLAERLSNPWDARPLLRRIA